MSYTIPGLEESFDNEQAAQILSLSYDRVTTTSELLRKSMYDFDLETPEGIEKLMALLPIMDPDILKDVMTEIWPGYPTDIDARRHRLEIKGYLKDYLEAYDAQAEANTATPSGLGTSSEEAPETQEGVSLQAIDNNEPQNDTTAESESAETEETPESE